MTQDRRERVRELFLAACDLDRGGREAFLGAQCAGDPALRAEIDSLLANDDPGGDFLAAPALAGAFGGAGGICAPPAGLPPESIGPYRIVSMLGEGGFGVVYLAEQTEPIRRRVALKVLKAGAGSRQVLARFEAERQALALMDHPNVARVFDAGHTPEGRPYFVMEYVHGEPITHFCDRQRLDLRRRMDLFALVCDAVQHAHGKGVIHRDLKPGNILVEYIDGLPVPKVIDFGVAKAVAARLSDRPLVTEHGQLLGTPEYMSPEQAEMATADIDTRSDVYALGVVLYELLTGSLPFHSSSLRSKGMISIQRMIREVDPPRPSTRLLAIRGSVSDAARAGIGESNSPASAAPPAGELGGDPRGQTLAAIAAARSIDPASLLRAVRSDLDWIVMKCLEKDRSRRYDTAHALALDIRRCLAGEPVVARPPSASYRIGKMVRRHRLASAMTGLAALLLVAGTVVSAWQAVRARRAESAQRAAAAHAQTQAAIATAVNAFLNRDLLAAADPELHERGRTLTVREALDNASRAVEGRFADQPLVEAAIRLTLGVTYNSLGDYDAAVPHVTGALQCRRALLGPDDPQTLEAQHVLGATLMNQQRLPDAQGLLQATLDRRREILGAADPATIETQVLLGLVIARRARFDEAIGVLESARAAAAPHPTEPSAPALRVLHALATTYADAGRLSDAEPLMRTVLHSRRRILGEDHPETIQTANNLALMYVDLERHAQALPLLEHAARHYRERFGEDHSKALWTMNNLAISLRALGRLDEAGELFRAVLERRRRALGDDHSETLTSANNLASLYRLQNRHDLAEPLFRASYESSLRLAGPDHPDTISIASNLALTWQSLGRHDEAGALYDAVIPAARRAFPAGHWALGVFLTYHGEGLTVLQRFDRAEPALLEAHRTLEAALGPVHERTLRAAGALAALYDAMGDPERSRRWRRPDEPPARPPG